MTRAASVLLGLLKSSLGYGYSGEEMRSLSCADWRHIVDLVFDNGVAALAVDGLQKLYESNQGLELEIDSEALEDLKYEWFGSTLQAEDEYSEKFKLASRFASALAEKGVKCFVLKGMSFAKYYSVPEHRECGDCDVYLGEGWAVGNEVAVAIGGRYDSGTRKHSHLFLGDLMIENHRYITNSGWARRQAGVENLLRKRLEENGQISHIRFADSRSVGDSSLLCPCDHFNALFLLVHAVGNFTSSGMSLRMIYDWAALLEGCQDSLDWKQLYEDMDVCGVRKFADVMTSICVEHFGVVITNPHVTVSGNRELVDEVLSDVMKKGIFASSEGTFWQKVVKMFRRYGRYHHYRILLSAPWWKVVCWSILDKFSSGIRKAAK